MRLNVVPRNEQVPVTRWKIWANYSPQFADLHFNSTSPAELASSIWYIVDLGKKLKQMSPQVQPHFSVPAPGPGQLEAIVAGQHDAMYLNLFRSILAIFDPTSTGRILIRALWEMQFEWQKNAARNKQGAFDPPLYVAAFRKLVALARSVSSRFYFKWCPNHGRHSSPYPLSNYYPGDDVVDEIAFDFYMQEPGGGPSLDWIVNSEFGALWFRDFARLHGKPWSVSELGASVDAGAPILRTFFAWLRDNGCSSVGWYDRSEDIDSEVSNPGSRLQLVGAVVKEFAR